MASGYIEFVNTSGVCLSSAWLGFLVTTSAVAGQLPIPTSGCKWTALELQIEGSSALDIDSISIMITWDSAGRYGLHGPSQSTYNLDFKTASAKKAVLGIDLNIVPTFPSAHATNGQCYVWLKGNASSTNDEVKLIRIHWHELSKG